MKTFKIALLFYPLYVVLITCVFATFESGGALLGVMFGVASYPILWFLLVALYTDNLPDKREYLNGDDQGETGERTDYNRR